MPTQDAYGRWISDDGRHIWDGSAWQPTGALAPGVGVARGGSPWKWVLLGCGGVALLVILGIGACTLFFVTNPATQAGYAQGLISSHTQAEGKLDSDVAALQQCEDSTPGQCTSEVRTARSAAVSERAVYDGVAQAGLLPDCLKPVRTADDTALGTLIGHLDSLSHATDASTSTDLMTQVEGDLLSVHRASTSTCPSPTP